MARYPGTLESANTNEFGIVFADHIQGHKTVADLNALYNISDAILSKSKTNAGNDALGQEWYVESEGYYYRLDNWANRRQASGWRQLQNTDEEFDSLETHGADKIKNFTTSANTVTLNYNTWKNSTTNQDGSATIPAATGDQAGVLTANGKDQLTQLNKIGEVTHLTDGGVFTEEAGTVTIHYQCVNSKEGATSAVVTKSEAIPEATLTKAGVLSAAKRNQLEQLDKIGEVTHLTDGGVFTTTADVATIHYQCVDTNSGANSAVSTKSANIPAATLTNAGVLTADGRNQLEQLDKIGEVTHLTDGGVFTTSANTVTMHYQCVDTNEGANSAVSTKTAVIPEATLSQAGTLAASNRNQLEQLNKIQQVSHVNDDNAFTSTTNNVALNFTCINTTDGDNTAVTEHSVNLPVASRTSAGTMSATDKIEHDRINTANFALGAVTPSTTAVAIAASKTNITNGSSVANNITIPGVTESAAGVMSAADKAKLNDITIPEGGVDFSGDATDVINGAGDSVDLMAKFPTTVVTNLTGVTPSTSAATINFTRSAKDTLDYNAATSNTVTIPGATTSAAGLMSATDKTEHDRITTTNFTLGAVTPSASTVQIAATKTTISTGASAANNITLPAVTESAAGVMSSADKAKLNNITIPTGGVDFSGDATDVINGAGDSVDLMAKFPATMVTNITGVTPSASTATINFTRSAKDTLDYNAATGNTVTIPAATSSAAGVMTGADKVKLDTTLPSQISNEITNRTNADNTLRNTINSNKSTIDNYTINSQKISTNPVLDGADIRITGYSQPGSTSALTATDTINGALGKLERGLNNEISNRTSAVNSLRTEINNNINTKLTELEDKINDNIDTRLTEVEGEINNTINPKLTQLQTNINNEVTNRTNAINNLRMFKTVTVAGTQLTADSNADTLTITAGSNVTLTPNATNDSFTISSSYVNTTYSFAGGNGSFTVTPSGGKAQTVSIGKPSTAGTADTAKACTGNSATASRVNNNLVLKVNSGTTEGTNQYTFNGSAAKTLNIVAGSNVTLTPTAGSLTIAAKDTNTTYSAGSNLTLSGTTFALNNTLNVTRVNASSGFYQQSDERLKSEIKPLGHTLDEICAIPTDSFILNGKQDIGTIAQGLEEICPEVVAETELKAAEVPNPENFTKVERDGETYVVIKEVDYAKLSILALEGVKLLKAEIDELKKNKN